MLGNETSLSDLKTTLGFKFAPLPAVAVLIYALEDKARANVWLGLLLALLAVLAIATTWKTALVHRVGDTLRVSWIVVGEEFNVPKSEIQAIHHVLIGYYIRTVTTGFLVIPATDESAGNPVARLAESLRGRSSEAALKERDVAALTRENQPSRSGAVGELLTGLLLIGLSVIIFSTLAKVEASPPRSIRLPAIVIIGYELGGKWLASALVAGGGALALLRGVLTWLAAPAPTPTRDE